MIKHSLVAPLALRKSGDELVNTRAKINRQTQDRSQLDNDGIHLPISVAQVDAEETLGDTEVRGRADRKKFGQSFNNSEQDRQQVWVQSSYSPGEDNRYSMVVP